MASGTKSLTVRLRLRAQGFSQGLARQKASVRGFGALAKRVSANVASATGRALDKVAAPGAIASSLGLGLIARDLVELEDRLKGIRVNAGAGATDIDDLKDRVMDLAGAGATHQGPLELLTAIESLLAKDSTLIDDFLFTDLLERIGVAATATGADIGDVAETAFQLHNALKLPWEDVGAGLDTLAVLGKEGAFELRDMAQFLPAVASQMERIGQTGPRGLARTGAALQIVRRRTADASTAANNLVNAISFLQSPAGAKRLGGIKVKVFDRDGTMRDLFSILDEVRAKTEGGRNVALLSSIFTDRQAREGVSALISDFGDLQRLTEQGMGGGKILDADASIVASSTAAALKDLKTELLKLADVHVLPWIEKLGDLVRWLGNNPKVLERALKVTGAIVTVAAVRAALRTVSGIFAIPGGQAGPAGLGGGSRVFVTNWPGGGGLGGGDGLGPAAAGGAGGAAKSLLKRGLGLGRGALGAAGSLGGGLLAKLGLGGLATTLGGGVGAAGAATVGGVALAGGAAGYGIGTAINEWVLPEGFKTGLQDAMAFALSPFSSDLQRLVRQNRSDRATAREDARRLRLGVELDPDSMLREVGRDG